VQANLSNIFVNGKCLTGTVQLADQWKEFKELTKLSKISSWHLNNQLLRTPPGGEPGKV